MVVADMVLLAVGADPIAGDLQTALQTIGGKNEIYLAAELKGYQFANNAGAIAISAWALHSGTAGLTPIDGQSLLRFLLQPPPAHQHAAVAVGKCPVLGRVGGKLVQHHSQRLHRLRRQRHARASDGNIVGGVGCKFAADDFLERDTLPATATQQFVHSCQGRNAPIEGGNEIGHRCIGVLRLRDDCPDGGEQVLRPVVELGIEDIPMLLRLLALGDIDIDAYHALWRAIVAIHDETARLDPAQLTFAHEAVFDAVFAPAFVECLQTTVFDPLQILWMNARPPQPAGTHVGPFGQTMYRGVALGNLHGIGVDVIGIATDQGSLARQRQLQVAFGQSMLRALDVRDVATDAEQSSALGIGGARKCTLDGNPALFGEGSTTRARYQPVLGSNVVAEAVRGDQCLLQVGSVLHMHAGPSLVGGLGYRTGSTAMDLAVTGIAFKAVGLQVDAPNAELCRI